MIYRCPRDGVVTVENPPQWMINQGCTPQCQCGEWMEELNDEESTDDRTR